MKKISFFVAIAAAASLASSAYQPTGDQPEAIAQLTEGVREGLPAQTLLG